MLHTSKHPRTHSARALTAVSFHFIWVSLQRGGGRTIFPTRRRVSVPLPRPPRSWRPATIEAARQVKSQACKTTGGRDIVRTMIDPDIFSTVFQPRTIASASAAAACMYIVQYCTTLASSAESAKRDDGQRSHSQTTSDTPDAVAQQRRVSLWAENPIDLTHVHTRVSQPALMTSV